MNKWETAPKNITHHFLKALIQWQAKGSRSFSIEVMPQVLKGKQKAVVWCYDHIAMEGRHVTRITEIPTTVQLLEMKKASIEKEKTELKKKEEDLEASNE